MPLDPSQHAKKYTGRDLPALDELVGFGNELFGKDPGREICIRRYRVRRRVPCDLRDLGRWVHEIFADGLGARIGGGARQPVGKQQLGIVFANGCGGLASERRRRRGRTLGRHGRWGCREYASSDL